MSAGNANVIQLRETCHSEAVTDVTAVGIRIQNVRENGLPRQSADWLAMTGRGVKYLLYSPRIPPELYKGMHLREIMGRGQCFLFRRGAAPFARIWT